MVGKEATQSVFLKLLVISMATAVLSSLGQAQVTRFYKFNITMANFTRLCKTKAMPTVNGKYPGPKILANEGDKLVITVRNNAPLNITIHWHGVFQNRTGWYDGPNYIAQCPIQTGESYTYKFVINNQKGTLWYHAHVAWLRSTVHGPLIVRPKAGYPFRKPHSEHTIVLGEWWTTDVQGVLNQALASGGGPNISDAFTINSQPGPFYNCSANEAYILEVKPRKTHLLRIINAALNTELFLRIANHSMTVVEIDGSYLKPFTTDVLVISPGQTTNVLFTANQPAGDYYIAARPYFAAAAQIPIDNSTTAGIIRYKRAGAAKAPTATLDLLPAFPAYNDTNTVTNFNARLKGLVTNTSRRVPLNIDRHLVFTVGLNIQNCPQGAPNSTCQGFGGRFAASMNNVSFVLPRTSILQAHYLNKTNEVFQDRFSQMPPFEFDYTGPPLKNLNAMKGTEALTLKYGENVQLILQGTSMVSSESHPIHLHGYDFFIVGQGFGNFNSSLESTFNLMDPPSRNTVVVPPKGWAAIRFTADNPGTWFMHCHLDLHTAWGLETVLRVLDGEGPLQKLMPPPKDYPAC